MAEKRRLSEAHRKAISEANKGRRQTEEAKQKIREAKLGKPRSEETKRKISEALAGRKDPEDVRRRKAESALRAEASPVWVGEEVSYNGAHNRARLVLPVACEHADDSCKGRLEVALRRDAPAGGVRVSRRGHRYYVGDARDGYMRLCISHHRRYDLSG